MRIDEKLVLKLIDGVRSGRDNWVFSKTFKRRENRFKEGKTFKSLYAIFIRYMPVYIHTYVYYNNLLKTIYVSVTQNDKW